MPENYFTVYWREVELLRVSTPCKISSAHFNDATLAILRTRCKDALTYMGWDSSVLKECVLYAFDHQMLCRL